MVPTGVEALIRWRSGARGVVQPNDFIPLLEETGLIVEVGRWVLDEACRQAAAWHEREHPISVAVNVSARQLETDDFIADVAHALAGSRLKPSALTLEITETALMRNPEQTARRLHAVKDLGVRVAIDDFGTGYSSFAHLKQFPVDALKIDRSFISQLSENPEGETLLRTLVQLGKALSIETLAEGIELRAPARAVAGRALRQRPGLPVRATTQRRGRRSSAAELACRRSPHQHRRRRAAILAPAHLAQRLAYARRGLERRSTGAANARRRWRGWLTSCLTRRTAASAHWSRAGIGSASAARPAGASKGSAKYWVSCVTRPSVNSMTLSEYVGTPS